jgi:hypothetical protein
MRTNSLGYILRKEQSIISDKVFVNDGLLATPSIAFESDRDSGVYRTSAGNVAVVKNGAQVAGFSTTGTALTGTLSASGATTLSSTLAVTGASTLTGAATLSSTLAVTGASTFTGSAAFNSTTSGSLTSGTFTPTITPSAGTVTSASTARYYRVNKSLTIAGHFTFTEPGSGTSFTTTIAGSPITPDTAADPFPQGNSDTADNVLRIPTLATFSGNNPVITWKKTTNAAFAATAGVLYYYTVTLALP